MFQSILANLSYSPSTFTYLRFYSERLRREELTRKLGLFFSAFAVVLQSFAIISPPEPTLAAGPNNIIYSGVTSINDLLKKYDANDDGNGHKDVQQIFTHYGISRDDLANAKITTIRSTDHDKKLRSIGRKPYGKSGETAVAIPGTRTTVYERWLWSWDSGAYSTYKAIQGKTSDGRWFAVIMNCGNIVIDEPVPTPLDPIGEVSHTCDAITGWAYDPNAPAKAIKVLVYIRLDGSSAPVYKTTVKANLATPRAPVSGNHGFKVTIPEDRKSSTRKTIYTVVALDAAGGGKDIDLARTVYISELCKAPEPQPEPEPEPEPEIDLLVCDTKTGAVRFISSPNPDPKRYVNPDQCEQIEVCINDKMVAVKRYEASGKPTTCPPIKVCRDGIVIVTTSDKRQPGDSAPSECVEIEVCRDGEVIVIPKSQRQSDDQDPHPELICDDPFPVFVYTKSVRNETQDIDDANGTTANPGDTLVYTLNAKNIGYASGEVEFTEDMTDVLEYAEFIEASDGALIETDNGYVLNWGTLTIEQDEEVNRTVTVKVSDEIPASPTPSNNRESNNLELRNVWHNKTVVVKVPRPVTKTPEILAATLPKTGSSTSAIASFVLIVFASYFYARNRQLQTELKLVQRDYVSGGAA